ncbi:MAG: ABC transporter substrate-binding protein [Actinomycetota bacterium]
MARTRRFAALLATSVLLLSACSAGDTADPEEGLDEVEETDDADDEDAGQQDDAADDDDAGAEEGGSLTVGFAAEPASLDFSSDDGAAIPEAVLVNVYEPLVKVDQDGELQPLLAESYEVSEDGTVYDFYLQEGVTFSNGDPFDAEAVAFSIERVQEDWTIGLAAGMDVVEDVEVVDDLHARVTLSQPSNRWLFDMTTRIGAMFSPDGVEGLEEQAIGTGPYLVDEFARGERIDFVANDDYWGEAPAFDEVTFRYFEDPNALNNAMLAGDIDLIGTVQAPEGLSQFEDDDRFEIIEGTSNGQIVLSFNHDREVFDDLRVRQAIRQAIDRDAVRETAWGGYGQLIGSMVPPTDPWYEDLTDIHPYDPEQAEQLLEEADATDLELDFRIPNLPYAVNAAQTVQSQLASVGIDAQIDTLEFPAVWLDEVFDQADYDMSVINHVEPRDIVQYGNPDYYWRYDNQEVQELLEEADRGDEETFVENYREVARIISEDAASDWLFLAPNLQIANDQVAGVPENDVGEMFDLTVLERP